MICDLLDILFTYLPKPTLSYVQRARQFSPLCQALIYIVVFTVFLLSLFVMNTISYFSPFRHLMFLISASVIMIEIIGRAVVFMVEAIWIQDKKS